MEFSGIDAQGYFKAQTVVDVSALVHTANDERRIVYDETTKLLYVADDVEWKGVGIYGNIPENTVMWVYSDSPPDGWSLFSSSGDVLVAIKGGTYATGGTIAGNFTTPSHSHGLANHVHTVSGSSGASIGGGPGGDHGAFAAGVHSHNTNVSSSGIAAGSTGIGGSVSGYRPRARVGILCIR
jgi:hypothetical protein